jgi:hypothetical protein
MKLLLPTLVLALFAAEAVAGGSGNALFDELTCKGIAIPGAGVVKLTPPLIKPGEVPKDVDALLEKAADTVPVDAFIRPSPLALFPIKIEPVPAEGERAAQSINLSFVVHARLKALDDASVVRRLLSSKRGEQPTTLSAADLKKRGITVAADKQGREDYSTLNLTLLDKVQVEGVTHGLRTQLPGTILYAMKLDDRFKEDKQFPNQWQSIERTDTGEKLGPANSYTGLAAYIQVTELPRPKGGLLVEMHVILHEPPGWFGANLLRSKMPIAVRDNVQSFRRTVGKE